MNGAGGLDSALSACVVGGGRVLGCFCFSYFVDCDMFFSPLSFCLVSSSCFVFSFVLFLFSFFLLCFLIPPFLCWWFFLFFLIFFLSFFLLLFFFFIFSLFYFSFFSFFFFLYWESNLAEPNRLSAHGYDGSQRIPGIGNHYRKIIKRSDTHCHIFFGLFHTFFFIRP